MNFRNKKNVSLLLLALMLVQILLLSLLFAHDTSAATIKVQLTSDHRPGFIFCQAPNSGLWVGYATITGRVEAKDMGGEPEPTYVKTHVTVSPPTDKLWEDKDGNKYPYDQVTNIKPLAVEPTIHTENRKASIDPETYQIIVEGYAGKGYQQYREEDKCGDHPYANYRFDVRVTWEGEVVVPDQPIPDPVREFAGDFDVSPPEINFRESFQLKPKNFTFNGCTYDGHRYKIERDGLSVYTPWADSQSYVHSYSYSTYPSVIGIGTHQITLEIRTKDCGTKETATHTLIVNGPKNNRPPEFQVAWVRPGTNVPVSTVFEGEVLNLIYIDDPSVPTPYDPDGDPMEWRGFDFSDSSDWAKTIPEHAFELYNGWGNIRMTALGTQIAKGTMCDSWGACTTRTAVVHVITEDPVPVITAPLEVVEGRPVTPPIHGDYSYSPVPGRTIDHSRDIWTNRRDVYPVPGRECITLEVFDNTGRKSREPAVHCLTVKPDLPPVPKLDYITPSIRNVELTLTDESYSPDGDKIVERRLTYQYDSNNDGNFDDETVVPLTLDSRNKAKFKPQRVGKYRFTLYLKEDWGREATATYDLEIVNDSPTFTFNVSYEETEPRVSPLIPLPASQLVNSNNWRNMDFVTDNKPKAWGVNPYTGALGHTPENLGVSTYNYVKRSNNHEIYVNTISSSAGGYNVYHIPSNYINTSTEILDEIKDWFYIGNGYFAINRYDDDYNNYFVTIVKVGEMQKHINNQWVTRIDYKNQLVYTMTKSNRYNPVFYRYRMEDFLKENGTYNAIVDAKTAGFAQQAYINGLDYQSLSTNSVVVSSYGYFACTSYYSTNALRIFGWDGRLLYQGGNGSCPYPSNFNSSFSYGSVGYDRQANIIYSYGGQVLRYNSQNAGMTVIGSIPTGVPTPSYFFDDGVHYISGYRYFTYPSGKEVLRKDVPIHSYRDRVLVENNRDMFGAFVLQHDTAGYWYTIERYNGNRNLDVVRIGRDGTKETLVAGLEAGCSEDPTNPAYCNWGNHGQPYFVPLIDGSIFAVTGSSFYATHYILEPKQKQDDSFRILESLQQLAGDIDSSNVELNFQIRFNTDVNQNLYAGFSYNIQDRLNMYRVELNTWRLRLVKLVNGRKTVLSSVDVNVPLSEKQSIKIKRYADKHIIYFNGVPVIDLTDNTYTGGTFGPFSEIFKTEFFNMSYRDLSELGDKNKLQGVGIVGEELHYNTHYSDPENDPRITDKTSWTYKHVNPNKFLDAGDGKSGLSAFHNKTYNAEQPVMDKVGVYELSARTMDDPHPEYPYPASEFDSYRKESNTATQTVIIHRRPISDFDVSVAADGRVVWTDRSYDPDRWLSDTNYSTEQTGIDYRATRGILERKYYYISPSGVMSEQKLVTPTEIGWYTVGMAVKDEYDAWSPFTEKMVYIDKLPSPNEPPVAAFTVNPSTTYRGVPVTIESQSWDKEDGGRENLKHTYYLKNLTTGGPETVASASRTVWTKTFSTLGTFQIRLVVEDSLGQPAQAVKTVTIVNRKPQANVTTPASTSTSNPTKFDVLRPTFVWTYSDADGDAQSMFQVQIYRANGTLERDTGPRSGSVTSWTPTADLPERVTMYVRVRVHDGIEWGDWSAPKYFYIETNRPPVADFDWSPKPTYEGDTITLIDRSTDPDGDPLTYQWSVSGPNGYTRSGSTKEFAIPGADTVNRTGIYNVTLTVRDPKGASDSVTKSITVLPLIIEGEVHHTPEWNENRINYNKKVSGKTDEPRSYDIFWAGERFVLRANTTLTGTETKADTVTVHMDRGYSTTLSPNGNFSIWNGELYDKSFDHLRDGPVTFTFEAHYNNGVVKVDTVTVRIEGNYTDYFRIHRTK